MWNKYVPVFIWTYVSWQVNLGRQKNVPGLIGKLRYKDDTINFLFCEKIWVFKFISIKVPWNLYKIKNATNVLSKKLKFLYMNSNREKFFWVYWINSVCIQKFCIYHVIKWHIIKRSGILSWIYSMDFK